MNNFIKDIIEEKFASKSQQKYFYARSRDKTISPKERKKWEKMAKEFSSETNFKKLPEKVANNEDEIDEIIDEKGNLMRGSTPADFSKKNVTQNRTSDEVVDATTNMMGNYGTIGVQNYRKYWGEGKVITKGKILEIKLGDNLGADETILKDKSFKQALKYFMTDLGLSKEESLEKMKKLGYNQDLPNDKIIVVENPKNFIEEYIDELLKSKTKNDNDLINKKNDIEEEEINPIVRRQIMSLKNSMKTYGLNSEMIYNKLKNDE